MPLEFTFRDNAEEIRYTADPGPPGATPTHQWLVARELLPGVEAATAPLLQRLTGSPPGRAGLWVGVRHRGDSTRGKIYQRVEPRHREHARSVLARITRVTPHPCLVPVLVGVDSRGDEFEVYSRLLVASRSTIHAALAGTGTGAAFPAIEGCVADLRERLAPAVWDDLRVGVSFRRACEGPTVTTLFTHAAELFPNDLIARTRVLGLAERLGIELRAYRDATASLRRASATPIHGMVGLTPDPGGGVEISIGVAVDAAQVS